MTVQPVQPPFDGAPDLRPLAVAAATAAAPLVPSALPLTADAVPVPLSVAPPGAVALVATVTGTRSGQVLVVLDDDVRAALAAAAVDVDLPGAVRPALEAAAGVLGPVVLGVVREVPLAQLAAGAGEVVLVPLVADDAPTAWVGLELAPAASAAAGTASPVASALGSALGTSGLRLLHDVEMTLSVEIGRTRMSIRDLLALTPGSLVELDRAAGGPADLLVNGRLIARGEVVVVDEDFGLRITELVAPPGESPA